MRRTLALALAAAALLHAAPALADPMDLDLVKLGSPDPAVAGLQAASDARRRFAIMATEMGLALTSFMLNPPTTTGHSGFAFDRECAYAPVGAPTVGGVPSWPTRGAAPSQLLLPAFHVRKALPFSVEIGGRIIYVNQSTMGAAQGELKWAIVEGFASIPDVAVRGAYTSLFGQRDFSLSTAELDLVVGKKLGVGGVMTLTPYGAARLTWIGASTEAIQFGTAATTPPSGEYATAAAFPAVSHHDHHFMRYTVGVAMATYAVTVSLEGTYFAGASFSGKPPAALGPGDLPPYEVGSSISGALKLGVAY